MDNPRESSGLSQFLVDAGLLSADAVKDALDDHAKDGERIAAVFVNRGMIADAKLAQVLSYQLCLPWVSLEHVRFSPKLLRMIPSDVATRFGVVPVHVRRRTTDGRMTLYVATDDPTNKQAEEACAKASGLPVRMMVATPADITRALREEYGEPGEASQEGEEELAETSPDGRRLDEGGETPTPREGTSVKRPPPPPPRNRPDTDVAAAAARMSAPDLGEYVNSPAPPRITGPTTPEPAAAAPPIGSGPALSPNAAPGVPPERSPIPGLAAAAKVSPRIVAAEPDDAEPDDAEIEEIDEVEEERLPSTRRAVRAEPRTGEAFQSSMDLREAAGQALASQSSQPASETAPEPSPQPVGGEVFDEASWEAESPVAERDALRDMAPPPPPPPRPMVGALASAPPPPGAIPPPPPPPSASSSLAEEELEVGLDESEPPEEIEPEPDSSPPRTSPRDEFPEPVPTPRSTLDEEVVLVVGADDEFAYYCARALGDAPARIVRCTLMSAMPKAQGLRPFAIVVPNEMYAFDRFAFNKLALEADSPLIVWEAEYEPEQIALLLSIARSRAGKPER